MKLGVAGLSHETITFQPGLSQLEDFERFALYGPAIIEEDYTTILIAGGWTCRLAAQGHLIATRDRP